MITKSREYQALALLGPARDDESWRPRLELAKYIAWAAIAKQQVSIGVGESLSYAMRRLEHVAQAEIPAGCGIKINLTADVLSGKLTIEAKIA